MSKRSGILEFAILGLLRESPMHGYELRKRRLREPALMVDGEMQADTALVPEILDETFPFSTLKGGANVLIFPNLEAGNIAYKLLHRIAGAEPIGPILTGMSRPVHVLQRGAEVNDIVNIAAIAVVDAQDAGAPVSYAERSTRPTMLDPTSTDV